MYPASEFHIPDGLLASMTLLSEKPRHGVTSRKSALQSGINEANCTAAIGLRFWCSGIVSDPVVAPSKSLKQRICSALPTGRTIGISGGMGGVGSVGGGGEVVINYQSGQVSAFGFGGVQAGWNGGASGSVYTGFVYGLNGSNSNYSGGFTGVNGGAGFGGFAARSSGGLTGGAGGLLPTSGVTAAGVSFGGGLLSGATGGVTATNYSNPFQFGAGLSALIGSINPIDSLLSAAQQVCK